MAPGAFRGGSGRRGGPDRNKGSFHDHPHHPHGLPAALAGRRRSALRPRARRALRRGRLRPHHARGGPRDRPAPGRGRGGRGVGRGDVEDLLRHLRQGPLHRLRGGRPPQRAGRPQDVPLLPRPPRAGGGHPDLRPADVRGRGPLEGAGRPAGRHRQPPRRHGGARGLGGLHERGLARRGVAVPPERALPHARGLPRGARGCDGRGVPHHRGRRANPAARLPRPRALAAHAVLGPLGRRVRRRRREPTSRRWPRR